jgi:hypothetical protein
MTLPSSESQNKPRPSHSSLHDQCWFVTRLIQKLWRLRRHVPQKPQKATLPIHSCDNLKSYKKERFPLSEFIVKVSDEILWGNDRMISDRKKQKISKRKGPRATSITPNLTRTAPVLSTGLNIEKAGDWPHELSPCQHIFWPQFDDVCCVGNACSFKIPIMPQLKFHCCAYLNNGVV